MSLRAATATTALVPGRRREEEARASTTGAAAVHALVAEARVANDDYLRRFGELSVDTGVSRKNLLVNPKRIDPPVPERGELPNSNVSSLLYALDALSRLDGAHDGICGGSIPYRRAHGYAFYFEVEGYQCDTNGYIMTRADFLPDTVVPHSQDMNHKIDVALQDGTQHPLTFVSIPSEKVFFDRDVVAVGMVKISNKANAYELALMDWICTRHAPMVRTPYFAMTEAKKKLYDARRYTPDERLPTLGDFVDNVCWDTPTEGRHPVTDGGGPVTSLDAIGTPARFRDHSTQQPRAWDTLDAEKKKASVPDPPLGNVKTAQKLITAVGYGADLVKMTTWMALGYVGNEPKGSIFLYYVDVATAYEKFPTLPIFRPGHVAPDSWEAYVLILRKHMMKRNFVREAVDAAGAHTQLDYAALHADVSNAATPLNRRDMMECLPFDANGDPRDGMPHFFTTDGTPAPQDYLYTTLVCAKPGGESSGFGEILLTGALELAKKIGVHRMVLSALPNVVSYYANKHRYKPCSRVGMDLSYALEAYRFSPRQGYGKASGGIDIHYAQRAQLRLPQNPAYDVFPATLTQSQQPDRSLESSRLVTNVPRTLYTLAMDFGERVLGELLRAVFAQGLAYAFALDTHDHAKTAVTEAKKRVIERMKRVESDYWAAKPPPGSGSGRPRSGRAGTTARERSDTTCNVAGKDARRECVEREFGLHDSQDQATLAEYNPPVPYFDLYPGYAWVRFRLLNEIANAQQATYDDGIAAYRTLYPRAPPLTRRDD